MLRTDTLHITPEVLSLIAGMDEFKGAWRALGALAPDRSWKFTPFRTATGGCPAC